MKVREPYRVLHDAFETGDQVAEAFQLYADEALEDLVDVAFKGTGDMTRGEAPSFTSDDPIVLTSAERRAILRAAMVLKEIRWMLAASPPRVRFTKRGRRTTASEVTRALEILDERKAAGDRRKKAMSIAIERSGAKRSAIYQADKERKQRAALSELLGIDLGDEENWWP